MTILVTLVMLHITSIAYDTSVVTCSARPQSLCQESAPGWPADTAVYYEYSGTFSLDSFLNVTLLWTLRDQTLLSAESSKVLPRSLGTFTSRMNSSWTASPMFHVFNKTAARKTTTFQVAHATCVTRHLAEDCGGRGEYKLMAFGKFTSGEGCVYAGQTMC